MGLSFHDRNSEYYRILTNSVQVQGLKFWMAIWHLQNVLTQYNYTHDNLYFYWIKKVLKNSGNYTVYLFIRYLAGSVSQIISEKNKKYITEASTFL